MTTNVLLVVTVTGFTAVVFLLWSNIHEGAVDNCPQPIFVHDALPGWTSVPLEGFTVDIPYSSLWSVKNARCLWGEAHYDSAVYQIFEARDSYGESRFELAFGRPVNNLTSIDREYHLSQRKATDMDVDVMPDGWSCLGGGIETPKEITIHNITGWRYFRGGAKWCEIVFRFTKEGRTYSLEPNLEPRVSAQFSDVELSEIDAEMQRIIVSIQPQEFQCSYRPWCFSFTTDTICTWSLLQFSIHQSSLPSRSCFGS